MVFSRIILGSCIVLFIASCVDVKKEGFFDISTEKIKDPGGGDSGDNPGGGDSGGGDSGGGDSGGGDSGGGDSGGGDSGGGDSGGGDSGGGDSGGGDSGGGDSGGGDSGGGDSGGGDSGGDPGVVSSIPKTAPSIVSKKNSLNPSNLWAPNTFPKPANRWWDNMVIDRYGTSYGVENVIAAHPYILKGTATGLEICYPIKDIKETYIVAPYVKNVSFGSTFGNFSSRQMVYADDFTFKMIWKAGNNSSMSIPITRGSPYTTAEYTGGITPELKSVAAFLTINGSQTSSNNQTKFKLTLNNGQTWILYSSSPVSFEKAGNNTIRATSTFVGTLQLALSTGTDLEAKLDQYKLTYVTSGAASYSVSGNQATINFNFKTNNNGDPLLMGLPHHQDSGQNPSFSVSNSYDTIKGKMIPIVGKKWTLKETLPTTTFYPSRGVDTDKVSKIVTALQSDKNLRPTYDPDNPYYYGKQMARMGRLALIAEQLGENDIKLEIVNRLKQDLLPWIKGTNNNPLRYDSTWGSVATLAGLDDPGRDFGIGEHNDIHFHFGYFVDAFAVIGRTDLNWVKQHKDWIFTLIRTYANPHTDDPHFPHVRHKDWYMGHSWASGIVSFSSGNNMESTSESVNSYYAIMLLGETLGDQEIYNFGRVMTATEIRSAQKYWQIKSASEIYPMPFKNKKVVGILWDTKVEYSTWFGINVEWIHGIQMLPYTPITEILLKSDWIQEEYPILKEGLTRPNPIIEERWKGYVYMTHAIIDKNAAWSEVQSLTAFDNGNSRTNAYYWVATRPGSEPTISKRLEKKNSKP